MKWEIATDECFASVNPYFMSDCIISGKTNPQKPADGGPKHIPVLRFLKIQHFQFIELQTIWSPLDPINTTLSQRSAVEENKISVCYIPHTKMQI